jgi:hypothetical protein
MRILIAAAALLLPMPVLADIVPEWTSRTCAIDNRVVPTKDAKAKGFQRLDRLPPAAEYLTVYRAVGGCPTPVVVRYGIGAPRR